MSSLPSLQIPGKEGADPDVMETFVCKCKEGYARVQGIGAPVCKLVDCGSAIPQCQLATDRSKYCLTSHAAANCTRTGLDATCVATCKAGYAQSTLSYTCTVT